jgi:iron complex outermembrane receptor protein
MSAAAAAGALALALASIARGLPAQTPEEDLPAAPAGVADSVLRFEADRISVRLSRPSLTMGGSSVALLGVDSLPLPPSALLEEGLRRLPLVQVRTNSRGEAHVALRGARSRQVAVLVDDVPLTIGWDHRTDLSVVPLLAVRELRLVRGPASLLHGPNVIGGVVELGIHDAPAANPAPLQAAFGTDQGMARAAALEVAGAHQAGAGAWTVRAGGGYRARDGTPLPEGVAQPAGGGGLRLNSDLRQVNGFLALRYDARGGAWATMSALGYRAEKGVPPELHVEEPRLWRIPEAHRLVTTFAVGTGWRATAIGQGRLRATLGFDRGHTEILSYESLAYDVVEASEVGDDRTLSARVVGEHSLGAGSLRSGLTIVRTSHRERLDEGDETRFVQRLWSMAAEIEQPLPLARRAGWSAGAVADGADTPETGGREPLGRMGSWGARFGATMALADEVVLHGGVSRRVRFPSLAELYSAALGRFAPNPSLEPEKLVVAELGLTARGSGWEVQAVGFRQHLADAIARTVTAEGRLMRVNREEVRSTGLELLGRAPVGPATASGSLTIQRVRLRDPDAGEGPAEYEPAVAGAAQLVVPMPLELAVETGVEFVGRQHCIQPGRPELAVLGPSTELDMDLTRAWRLSGPGPSSRIEGRIGVENLTDAAVYDQCGLPRPGRTLRVELRLR